jgi:Na+/H+ antiporter NhaC
MQTDDLKEKAADIINHVEELAETFYRLTIVKITQKAANITSGVFLVLLVCLAGLFVLLFAGLAFAWWIGDVINSRAGGFLFGAVFFLLIITVLMMARKKIIFPYIRNTIIRKIYDEED